tara:strand:- start:1445 stop:2125 length:681 start_codon:yes stop_codon:yes gene_type:complete
MVWDDTRAFLAVARCGTLSAAAQNLNVGIATLSRRIERLESALKLPLFVRQQSGYELTEDGAELIEKAEALEAAAHAFAVGADTQAQMSGHVRLATAENVATELILPELPAFRAQYPDLLVELVTDISTANLHRRDADLALRMVRPERGNVTLRALGTLGYGLYCSTSYELRRESNPDLGVCAAEATFWHNRSKFFSNRMTDGNHFPPVFAWPGTASSPEPERVAA